MSFDGMFIHHLSMEINEKIKDARIDKIHQPEKDELTIGIRSAEHGSLTLFISVDSSIPYFTLTDQKKENPMEPPMFCMLMRKHLSGGRIISFKQMGYERTLVLTIEAKNDFGELEEKKLFIEIMGKHSNIILTKEDLTVIDSIKRISPELSRVRTILPGVTYSQITSDKISPESPFDLFKAHLQKKPHNTKLFKALYTTIEGFSPFFANALTSSADLDSSLPISEMYEDDYQKLYTRLKAFLSIQKPKAYMVSEENKGPITVYYFDTHLPYQNVEILDTLSKGIEKFYTRSNKSIKMHQRLNDVRKAIQIKYDRSVTKRQKLMAEINEAEHADHQKILGDLIYANLYQISKGMNVVTVDNFYDPEGGVIDIPLDVRLDPNENAQAYYKKYTKLKTAQKTLETQLVETDQMIDYLENILVNMQTVETTRDIDELLSELAEQGFIRKRYKKQKQKNTKPDPKKFRSSEGYEILVGKNNLQNDYLTLKIASNKDIWLHTKIIPGSHVVIRTQGEEVSEQTIMEAAMLAAHFSKASQSSNVPVDYTLIKYVTKPNGAKPGMVIYTHNKTLYVTPDLDLVETLSMK